MVFISEINKRFEFEDKKMSTIFGRSSNDSLVMKAVSISFQRVQECFWHPHSVMGGYFESVYVCEIMIPLAAEAPYKKKMT